MKIEYKYVTGKKVEIEVDEEVGAVIDELDRLEHNNNQTETRRHTSLELIAEFPDISEVGINPLLHFIQAEEVERFAAAISHLRPKQAALVRAVYFDGLSVQRYAQLHGVQPSTISHRLRIAENNLKKILKNPQFSLLP